MLAPEVPDGSARTGGTGAGEPITTGHVLGIDRSARMTALARQRNAAAIRAGRAIVRTGALRDVDLGPDRFDLVFAINVALFARPCDRELARLREVLAPDGRILAFYQAPAWAHALRFGADARARFEHAGFAVEVEEHPPIGVLVRAH